MGKRKEKGKGKRKTKMMRNATKHNKKNYFYGVFKIIKI